LLYCISNQKEDEMFKNLNFTERWRHCTTEILGITRTMNVAEVSFERSPRNEFKLISFNQIAGVGPEFRRKENFQLREY